MSKKCYSLVAMKKLFAFTSTVLLSIVFIQAQTPFKPGCKLPFYEIQVKHTIDNTCPVQGKATKTNTKANANQNKVKNNFCAQGEPEPLKVDKAIELHQKVMERGISFGSASQVPEDRSGLSELGEGTVVYFIGYIQHAKYSNVSSGESVNCKKKGAENNDIHIELIEKKTETDDCKRISAEVSPHFRPNQWNVDNLNEISERKFKVKITGQLFFDASHGACPDNEDGYRASSWEIHPVYKIEVYVGKKWISLDEWAEDE